MFVYRSEPFKSVQVDMYANPEDFIKTPPHMPPRKNEGGEDQREVPKLVEITNNEVPVSHNTCCYVLLVYPS